MGRMYVICSVALFLSLALGGASAWGQQPELVSVNLLGNNGGNFISGAVTTGRSPGISDDGRMVVFESRATDLVSLTDANGYSSTRNYLNVSANGRFVAFESYATNLESTNGDAAVDVYIRDHCLGATYLMNPNLAGTGSGNNESDHVRVSANGRWVVFSSRATDLATIDTNGWIDTYRSEVPNWGDWGCGVLPLFSDGFESGDTSRWTSSTQAMESCALGEIRSTPLRSTSNDKPE